MRWLLVVIACGCADLGSPDDMLPPGPGPDPESQRIEVTLDGLQAGWRVTTSRLVDHDAPSEVTITSDGLPIVLAGGAGDQFVATVTDEAGAVVAMQSMNAPCNGQGEKLRVPDEFPTIQAAIDAAEPGDTVKVSPGTYTEYLKMRPGVCLLGTNARNTILDARDAAESLVDLTAAPGSTVSGFTMRGTRQPEGCARPSDPFACSGDWYRAAIYIGGLDWDDPTHDAPPLITNNVFEHNDTGVMFYWRSAAVLRNNVFHRNRVGFVANHYGDRALVANNVFFDNTELAIGNQAAYLDIIDNVIAFSEVGILFEAIQTGHIRCNIFWGNGAHQADVHIVPPRFAIGEDGNREIDPRFDGESFRLTADSPAKNTGCHGDSAREVDGSLPDIGVYGGPLAAAIDL